MKGFIAIAVLCVLLCGADAIKIPEHNKISALDNPFMGSNFYVNPSFQQEVQGTINANPQYKSLLSHALNISTAYWIDKMAKVPNITVVLDGALAEQKKTGVPTLTAFVVYDLPNRDCAAAASNGEIPCADSTCAEGLATYKTKYVDAIAAVLKKYTTQPIVLIIEPDSLPNLATNLNIPKCQEAETAYINGVAYAIQQFGKQKNLYMYVDAAHGGWLGWTNNLVAAAQIFLKVLTLAGGPDLIRGFATNTANYQPLGSLTSTVDPCGLKSQYNFAINEVIFVNLLSAQLELVGITGKGFIIDTSRNGVIDERESCSNWCNIKGSGFGFRPTANPAGLGVSNIDALYWVKTPGESDGSSDQSAPRYDFHCDSVDSQMPAPQAGIWFPSFFINLALNAIPALM